jgi:hypothetical protein
MAYEFKKISEVEIMNEVPSDATVLGVSGGQVVQMPSSGLGSGGDEQILFGFGDKDYISEGPTFEEMVQLLLNNPERLANAMLIKSGNSRVQFYKLSRVSGCQDYDYNVPFVEADCLSLSFMYDVYYETAYLWRDGYAPDGPESGE